MVQLQRLLQSTVLILYEQEGSAPGKPRLANGTGVLVDAERRVVVVGNAVSRGNPERSRSAATRSRMPGSAAPNAAMRENLVSSREARHFGW